MYGGIFIALSQPAVTISIPKDRVTTLIDSIYAFAMTLLVVTIEIPSKFEHAHDIAPVYQIVLSILPDLYHYFIAFTILAMLWYFHHQQFHHLVGLNRLLLCSSMASLAFVCLIPFSTNIAGDYPYDTLGAIIFELDVLVIGLITLGQWYYIRNRSNALVPHLAPDRIQREILWSCVFPILSITGIALALIGVPWSVGIFLLAPFVMAYLYRKAPV
ncbi:MAG: DUF1211 domain-containing protein [Methanoregula sp.]|nr:DUF1211 domain-containing protein [Methanoregula sp.]